MNNRPSDMDGCIRRVADPDISERIRRAANQLFTEAKHLSEITSARVLELAGGDLGREAFYRVFPGNLFSTMKQTWLHRRIWAAMDEVFAAAQTQRDISQQRIADLAGCNITTVLSHVGDEWRARYADLESSYADSAQERIRRAAERLFAEAKHPNEITRARVLELAGGDLGERAFYRIFPGKQFSDMQQAWLRQRIKAAMDEVFAIAQTQHDVSYQRVADLVGCEGATVARYAGVEWQTRYAALEDPRQRILQAIQRLVDARIPSHEYTWARVHSEASEQRTKVDWGEEIRQAFRDGFEALNRYHEQKQQQRDPHAAYACIQGNWINVDEPMWHLITRQKAIRHDRLRADIAAAAWPLLREEALSTPISEYTLFEHYQSCIALAKLLGNTIPDLRMLTLGDLQQAWCNAEIPLNIRCQIRPILIRLLEVLILQGATDSALNIQEYARVVSWLQILNLKDPAGNKDFLSDAEFDTLLDACLQDILQGLAHAERFGLMAVQPTANIQGEETIAVLHWGIALILLLMAFTGLRVQSITRLTIDDIAQIGPQVFALAWRHGKPGKERIAIIPALVAEHLQHYIHITAPVRVHLGTSSIFFARNRSLRWDHMTVIRLGSAFASFVHRHALTRDGAPLQLGSTLLRRTYATRALYELPSIAALQAQLGHEKAETTLGYTQHDRFEHPAQVDGPLDAFGRKVLARWHQPILLETLPDKERQELLRTRVAREQDVGMCRYDRCLKLADGPVSPCSMCEHLVSGPEYVAGWEREKVAREQQLERLAHTPGVQTQLAQMKGQYDHFLLNYQFIREGSRT